MQFVKLFLKEVKNRLIYKKYFIPENEQAIISKATDEINKIKLKKPKKKILINAAWGHGTDIINYLPIFIGSLKKKNIKVQVGVCNKALSSCELNLIGNNTPHASFLRSGFSKKINQQSCDKCCERINSLLTKIQDIEIISYSSNKKDGDSNLIDEFLKKINFKKLNFMKLSFMKVEIGLDVKATYQRLTQTSNYIFSLKNSEILKRIIRGHCEMVLISKSIIRNYNFDSVLLPHGFYTIQGTFKKTLNNSNFKNCYNYVGGIRKETIIFSKNDYYQKIIFEKDSSAWKKNKFSKNNLNQIKKYMNNKFDQSTNVDNLMLQTLTKKDEQEKIELKVNSYKSTIVLFTNVTTDSDIFYKSNPFKNIFEWISFTIDYYKNKTDHLIIIRIHPAELFNRLGPVKDPMLKYLKTTHPDIFFPSSNFHIIKPEDKINSLYLANLSNLCIVYGSKISLEIIFLKKRLILVADNMIKNQGFSYDPNTKRQYLYFLKNFNNLNNPIENINLEIMYKFLFYIFFIVMRKIPNLINLKTASQTNIDKNNFSQGLQFKSNNFNMKKILEDENLDFIFDKIIKNKEIY